MTSKVGLIALITLALAVTGCSTPVGVDRTDARSVYAGLTINALAADQLSSSTTLFLHRLGLFDEFERDPVSTLALLHRELGARGDEDRLFALAELNFLHGERSGERVYYLSSAVYAYAFLMPGDRGQAPEGFDPRFRLACDLYNRALTEGLRQSDGYEVNLESARLELPFGPLDIASTLEGFRWAGFRLGHFLSAADLRVRGLRNRYRRTGLGAPLSASILGLDAKEKALPGQKRIGPKMRVPVTAFLRLDDPRRALVEGDLRGSLEIYSPDDALHVKIGKRAIPLEFETTSSLALGLEGSAIWDFEFQGFRFSESRLFGRDQIRDGLLMLHPYRAGRIPVVLVHGTASSPARWAELVNELENDPRIWERYQIWLFMYNTGNPIALSGSQLREALLAITAELDPERKDKALVRTVVIGHSQGGLLTKLIAIASENRFWSRVSDTPFEEFDLKPTTRDLLKKSLFFEPVPTVQRLIYIATPHQGSYLTAMRLAGFSLSNWVKGLIQLPGYLTGITQEIVLRNPEAKLRRRFGGVPTSIDNMTPGNPFLQVLAASPVASGVTTHSIIAVRGDGPPELGNDGVVKYTSAHVEGVASELVVRSSHSTQAEPATIEEVRRILLEHSKAD